MSQSKHQATQSAAKSQRNPQNQRQSTEPDIILLHGLRGAPVGLRDVKSALEAHGYTVHTPAIPPFADAGTLPEYSVAAYANYVAEWIKTHHLERPILVGHSMGSMIVAAVAALYPDLIDRRIVFLSPISDRAAGPFRLVSPLASFLPSRLVDYVTSKFLFTGQGHDEFIDVMNVTHECGDQNREVSRSDLRDATKFSVSYGVGDILKLAKNNFDQKFYIIAGAKDRLVSQKSTKRLAEDFDANLTLIPGTGHLHNYEKPTETADLIAKFLEKA